MATVPPRDWLIAPEFFGERPDARWRRYLKSQETEVALAHLQHGIACAVRSALGHNHRTHADLAKALSDKPETVRKKLNGEIRMTLEDLLKWAMEIGVDVVPFPQDRAELLPPETLIG
jgi:hypothetical protein